MKVKVAQSCLTPCNPIDYTVHGILQARILEWVDFPFSRGSSQHRDRSQVSHIAGRFFTPTLQADSLPAEPQRKPKNTGVGTLSLRQRIFPTQGSNQGLLHWRRRPCPQRAAVSSPPPPGRLNCNEERHAGQLPLPPSPDKAPGHADQFP